MFFYSFYFKLYVFQFVGDIVYFKHTVFFGLAIESLLLRFLLNKLAYADFQKSVGSARTSFGSSKELIQKN